MTWGDAKVLIRGIISDTRAVWFEDHLLDTWARSVMQVAAERTRYLYKEQAGLISAAVTTVSLPDDAIQLRRIETGDEGRLRPITTGVLYANNRSWQDQTGTPRFYYMDTLSDVDGARTVAFYYTPSALDSYRMFFDSYPDAPSSATPTVELEVPMWCAHFVVYGVLSKCYEADTPVASDELAQVYRGMYDMLLDRLKVQADGRLPKTWVAGEPSHRALSVREIFPSTIPSP